VLHTSSTTNFYKKDSEKTPSKKEQRGKTPLFLEITQGDIYFIDCLRDYTNFLTKKVVESTNKEEMKTGTEA
jgi:hypothetical protein